jgi:hypothetical protein
LINRLGHRSKRLGDAAFLEPVVSTRAEIVANKIGFVYGETMIPRHDQPLFGVQACTESSTQ